MAQGGTPLGVVCPSGRGRARLKIGLPGAIRDGTSVAFQTGMSHYFRFSSRILLACVAVVAACSTDKDDVAVGHGNANYGAERIGYKLPLSAVIGEAQSASEADRSTSGTGGAASGGFLSDPSYSGTGGSDTLAPFRRRRGHRAGALRNSISRRS